MERKLAVGLGPDDSVPDSCKYKKEAKVRSREKWAIATGSRGRLARGFRIPGQSPRDSPSGFSLEVSMDLLIRPAKPFPSTELHDLIAAYDACAAALTRTRQLESASSNLKGQRLNEGHPDTAERDKRNHAYDRSRAALSIQLGILRETAAAVRTLFNQIARKVRAGDYDDRDIKRVAMHNVAEAAALFDEVRDYYFPLRKHLTVHDSDIERAFDLAISKDRYPWGFWGDWSTEHEVRQAQVVS